MLRKVMVMIKSGPEERSNVEKGLRISAAMIGMDYPQNLVFIDRGVECLRPNVLDDTGIWDYLKAAADLLGIYVLSDSLRERGLNVNDLNSELLATPVDITALSEMSRESDTVIAL
jgi:sulfur relay (sulfurtransferase) DsrF/TusC family protein